ncbi:MAG: peptide ABC transporter substrate-binding protein [Gammaproteobacteria bacterium]|nr:peptide ABC transporter substrate-binding protein [Gammaproteobacteria bacterium]
MLTKRTLIFVPAAVIAILLQAYWWVPTYETQLRGNSARATTYIEATSGDARLLNPIVNADTTSSRITDLVFTGLVKLDEDLDIAPDLATGWTLHERVFVKLADGVPVIRALSEFRARVATASWGDNVSDIGVAPAETRTHDVEIVDADDADKKTTLQVTTEWPERIRINLREIDQDFEQKLRALVPALVATKWQLSDAINWAQLTETLTPEARTSVAEQVDEAGTIVEHNPVLTFALRKDVTFHDGEAFDADDVRFTYEAIMATRNLSPRRASFEPIKTFELLDPHNVRIVYKRLYAPALLSWAIGMLPEHLLNASRMEAEMEARSLSDDARAKFGMRDVQLNRDPVGTGPYRFESWTSDELIHMSANAQFYAGAPSLATFYFRVIPDRLTQEFEFRAGALDHYLAEPHQIGRYLNDDNFATFTNPQRGYSYIAYNTRKAPFDDPRVRRALGLAIDVPAILRYVFYGHGARVTGPYPSNTPWSDPDVQPLAFDLEAARALLAEAGFKPGADGWLQRDGKVLELNLITNNGNPTRKAILAIAQDSWRKLGVKSQTQVFEWAVFLKDFVNPGKFDALVLGWRLGIDDDQFQLWHSSQTGYGQLNFTGFTDDAVDDLLKRIRREYDRERLAALTRRLHRRIAEAQPYTFLVTTNVARAMDRKLKIVESDGRLAPLRPARSGEMFYFMPQWTKSVVPELTTGNG